ncbi:GntR family transcriptional regulator [Pseudonocardia endophytica]|uniref:GntR family transcriptional regulator n=1 Tax=Pseudonocardia endophytica TaxID=401976 RepID=A0A4R1I031_PSEEN|nr:GntR family transcriptional regulator [Pseudonocardia endophytica]TCK26550.1 GntR family transcriptional regulator [Pseudonocardia endophytica]
MTLTVPDGAGRGHLVVPGSRDAAEVIHGDLRARILSGDVPAGSELSQTGVARDYRVSRGPVREAFRLLQRDGLIAAQVNQRARVATLSIDEVEHLYALRVANETMALAVSVPRFSVAELDELDRMVADVEAAEPGGFALWEERHHRFHMGLVRHGGARMLGSIRQWAEHTARYRRIYIGDDGWSLGSREHPLLVAHCRSRDVTAATTLLARHLSRAALSLIATMDPAHEPALLRAAIRQVVPAGDR